MMIKIIGLGKNHKYLPKVIGNRYKNIRTKNYPKLTQNKIKKINIKISLNLQKIIINMSNKFSMPAKKIIKI